MMMNEIGCNCKYWKDMVGFFKDLITKIMSYNSNKYMSGSKCNLIRRNL